MQGRADPRWLTDSQARSVGAKIRGGEQGTLVQYWTLNARVPVQDARGRPLERPKVFSAVVFNAEQIDGLPPLQDQAKVLDGDRHARAEAVLAASGADIRHDQSERAFYRPATDRIHLPERDRFQSADAFYACALHELGHWTGHPSRLGRDLAHPFGSEGYAREELRAAIASLAIGDRLGIGHDPGQHAAYGERWVKVLQDDPREILRAARDADQIGDYLLGREKGRPAETIKQPRPIDPAPTPRTERPPSVRAGRER